MKHLATHLNSKWFRSLATSTAAFFLLAGSAYAVTTIGADLQTTGTVIVGTGIGDQGIVSYDTSANSLIVNEAGNDIDFQVKTATNDRGIYLDAGADTLDLVGGSGSTGCTIDASGNLTCTGDITGGP